MALRVAGKLLQEHRIGPEECAREELCPAAEAKQERGDEHQAGERAGEDEAIGGQAEEESEEARYATPAHDLRAPT